jgi:hypothetical protein
MGILNGYGYGYGDEFAAHGGHLSLDVLGMKDYDVDMFIQRHLYYNKSSSYLKRGDECFSLCLY